MSGAQVLNKNPDNFFNDNESIAFCPAVVVPGIDYSEDKLLQVWAGFVWICSTSSVSSWCSGCSSICSHCACLGRPFACLLALTGVDLAVGFYTSINMGLWLVEHTCLKKVQIAARLL